jgi:SAM-dependent methyltransferase
MTLLAEDPTRAAYDSFAPFYDCYTHDYEYDRWLTEIEAVALAHGLHGSRLLDVGCGTGKSFLPLLERGYEVTACDISPAMVERARELVAGTGAEVLVADMRALPVLGCFDLVTSIDDAVNYLLSDEELRMAFEGVARNLRAGGLFAFDLNTLGCYRHYLVGDQALDVHDTFFCLRGEADPEHIEPGAVFSSVIEVFASEGDDCWRRSSSRHVQRHHPPELVERLLRETGFELVDRRGQVTGARLVPVGDENVHMKLDYFARRLPAEAVDSRVNGGEGHDLHSPIEPRSGGGPLPPPDRSASNV